MNKIGFLLLLLLPIQLLASNENHLAGARSDGMGKALVAVTDVWSGYHNQAALAKQSQKTFGAYYENRFESEELNTKALFLNYPTKLGSFGMVYSQFGFNLYKESKIGLSYSKALGKHFWAGLQFDQIRKELNQIYGSQSKYTFEVGLLAEIFPDFHLGFHLFNPMQTKFSTWDYEDEIPTIGRFGFSWKLSNGTLISSEMQKGINDDLQTKVGVEYLINEKIFFRVGFSNHPNSISMGLGLSLKFLKANLAFSRHPVLGYTPSIDINFSL